MDLEPVEGPLTRLLLLLMEESDIRQGCHNPKVPHYAKLTLCAQPVIGLLKNKKKTKTKKRLCLLQKERAETYRETGSL